MYFNSYPCFSSIKRIRTIEKGEILLKRTQKRTRNVNKERTINIVFLVVGAIFAMGCLAAVIFANMRFWQLRDLAQYSNADHGDTIEEFVRNVGYEDSEHIAIFNLKGKKLFEYTAEDNETVELPDVVFVRLFGDYHRQDLIAVHNHPGEFETPFSTLDLRNMHDRTPYIEQIVSTRSKVFILRQNKSGWPTRGEINFYIENVKSQLNSGRLREQFVFDGATGNLYSGNGFVQDFAEIFDLRFDETTVDDFNFADWAP